MITVSAEAANQIKASAKQGQMEGLALRLAATRQEDGSLHYAMGFADEEHDEDVRFTSHGVTVVVSPASLGLLTNTELDYVKMDNGEMGFIFKNPNDPNYQPAS